MNSEIVDSEVVHSKIMDSTIMDSKMMNSRMNSEITNAGTSSSHSKLPCGFPLIFILLGVLAFYAGPRLLIFLVTIGAIAWLVADTLDERHN